MICPSRSLPVKHALAPLDIGPPVNNSTGVSSLLALQDCSDAALSLSQEDCQLGMQ